MYNHASADYTCLFCCLVQDIESERNHLQQSDIIHQNDAVTAFVATRRFPKVRGHVLVIPNQHYENIYELPLEIATEVHALSQTVALAMKATYQCDGILIRQHNEPAGGQNVFHYHMHVIPRYAGDDFDFSQKLPFPAQERAKYAKMLRNWITQNR
jgi:histidine triad (HIT) family protein